MKLQVADLERIEALAKAATPGIRTAEHEERVDAASGWYYVRTGPDDGPGQTIAQWALRPDAELIAVLNPQTVVELVRMARKAIDP